MDMLITLVSNDSFVTDEIGQRIPRTTERKVWAHVQSVSRNEWFQGGQAGLQPELVADTPIVNYKGEKTAIVGKKQYTVYRTYFDDNRDTVSLYLEERVADVKSQSRRC